MRLVPAPAGRISRSRIGGFHSLREPVKRIFNVFVLTSAEQRLIILLVLLLVAAAWFKHQRGLNYSVPLPPTPSMSPEPQGTAGSKPPTKDNGGL
jgi:hypothetical protein